MELPLVSETLDPLGALYLAEEGQIVNSLANYARLPPVISDSVTQTAEQWVTRARLAKPDLLAGFLQEFDIGSHEGWVLMSLAESLLRIPDPATANQLINSLLMEGDWQRHRGHSHSALINAASLGLVIGQSYIHAESLPNAWNRLLLQLGDSVFRQVMRAGIGHFAKRFVFADQIEAALARRQHGLLYSFDMLGEAALTDAQAEDYFEAYRHAIQALGSANRYTRRPPSDSISIKLSALHPRYEFTQWQRCEDVLFDRMFKLCQVAHADRVPLTIDAEECDRLEISLTLFERLRRDPRLHGWDGLGLAVQAYQKRARTVIQWLARLATSTEHTISVRLVKGAYWDSEIKRAQQQGLRDYPVFTRKTHSDVSYMACAKELLACPSLSPQFATHNAHTLAYVSALARHVGRTYETQRLHGMGIALQQVFTEDTGVPCRVYAPVGNFSTLLPYLVRRMLENGSNQSFVHHMAQPVLAVADLVADPLSRVPVNRAERNLALPSPGDLYPSRPNSRGFAMSDRQELAALFERFRHQPTFNAGPIIGGHLRHHVSPQSRFSLADPSMCIGELFAAGPTDAQAAMDTAAAAFSAWSLLSVDLRADMLERMATRLEDERDGYLWLLMHEGGKVLADAQSELREAVDYCRYYATEARRLMSAVMPLACVTGESNSLRLHARGVFLCISPWNFPLAILLGQAAAALVSGNTVVVKPASQTPLLAAKTVRDLINAGVPGEAVQCLPGPSTALSPTLLAHPALAGVAMTGSTQTAKTLQRALCENHQAILPLIAETGGLNVMIADSTPLPEQIVRDVMTSAFNSAGQRCSACRILWIQEDIAEAVENLLCGAMETLVMGRPDHLDSDIGPVIDNTANAELVEYEAKLAGHAQLIARVPNPMTDGHYFAPVAYRCLPDQLPRQEVFGPLLHVVRYRSSELDQVIDFVNRSGYGLTLSVHSRNSSLISDIAEKVHVGNIYVNRNQIGAVVGCQPFGGEGLSGTGFKAGGPHYLLRFITERVVSDNLTALGINTTLAGMQD